MPPASSAAFRDWLKGNTGMKLSSDAAVQRILHEGINNYASLTDFDKKSIQALPAICREAITAVVADVPNGIAAEAAVPGANVSSISVRRLITAVNASKYYTAVNRSMTSANMHYTNVLSNFQLEHDDYASLKDQDDPTVPTLIDKDADRKVIKWAPIFRDCLSRTFGSRGPLAYVLRETADVTDEAIDILIANSYFGSSGSLLDELVARLPHTGAIYKNDNATVYMLIEKAVRGTSVESTVKTYARRKDSRGAYLALISNHAGDTKYRAISKKRLHLLQSVKWNGRSFPMESHVSNHCAAVDDLRECSAHITVSVPSAEQRVEYLIDSITCNDATLQAAIGLVRANTNNMRNDFELAAGALIEVDPYCRTNKGGNPCTANVSAIEFNAGRGETGVDFRWHPHKEFKKLPDNQCEELLSWMKTQEGSKAMKKSRQDAAKKRKGNGSTKDGDGDKKSASNWKKKIKKAIKTPHGFKAVMSVLAEEEKSNQGLIAAFTAKTDKDSAKVDESQISAVEKAFPATALKLATILKPKES